MQDRLPADHPEARFAGEGRVEFFGNTHGRGPKFTAEEIRYNLAVSEARRKRLEKEAVTRELWIREIENL